MSSKTNNTSIQRSIDFISSLCTRVMSYKYITIFSEKRALSMEIKSIISHQHPLKILVFPAACGIDIYFQKLIM